MATRAARKSLFANTRNRVFGALEGSDVLVIGTHFSSPTAGRVVREGAAWRLAV